MGRGEGEASTAGGLRSHQETKTGQPQQRPPPGQTPPWDPACLPWLSVTRDTVMTGYDLILPIYQPHPPQETACSRDKKIWSQEQKQGLGEATGHTLPSSIHLSGNEIQQFG